MILSSINKEQRLYVLRAGHGYTCYGFDVITNKAEKILDWLKEHNAAELLLTKGINLDKYEIAPKRKGTKKHFEYCDGVISAGQLYHSMTRKICNRFLNPQLVGLVGRRVEVVTTYGETRRFEVGVSTGWTRIFLEIPNSRSTGGMSAEDHYKSVRVIR